VRRGKKPNTPAELKARGTFRPVRHQGLVQFEAPVDLPQQPDWLTEAGKQAWDELIEYVAAAKSATAADSALLGTLANLVGASALCWQSGSVPPASHLTEQRRLCELFRIGGAVSRVGLPQTPSEENPYLALQRRIPGDGR
jgi:hypothetical protein